ncbi:MAG: chromosome segregation protein SMC [Lachnospiraceae bacterium]|nr:chromosome segregation protein SMC [Lachnospiraceae bacterium]
MYLKSIEVQGFKSFANKIVFDFHNGITGIVGPNGSGKSNVADAVRWVLGEQRVKQLRGSKMEDVIFAGTQMRKAIGYAYVSIKLDNSDRALAIDSDEVTVSRKVFRSGESEYLINGSICRLKDINELFYDTGIGKEGYSIIGQGQIDKILSGKPEERRELFDEAAGIVKFKKRKLVAQKSLDSERMNLTRIKDILSELEKQVGPLERQSEKAKQYLKLKEELKRYEVNLFLAETSRVKEQEKILSDKMEAVVSDLEASRQRYEATKEEYELMGTSIEEVSNEIEKLVEEQNTSVINIGKYEGQVEVLKEQIKTAQVNDEHINSRILSITEEIKQKNAELEEYLTIQKENENTAKNLEKSKEELEEKVNAAATDIEDTNIQIEDSKSKIIELLNQKAQVKAKLQRYETMLEQINIRKTELNSRIIKSKSLESEQLESLAGFEKEAKNILTQIKALEEENAGLEQKVVEIKNDINHVNEEIDSKKQEFHREQSKLESLKNITERYEGYGQSIKKVMELKDSTKGILGVIADIIKVEQKYELAIETALGGSIQNIVTDTETTAKKLIEHLKQNKYGRATFLPLSSINAKQSLENEACAKEKGVVGIASDLIKVDIKFDTLAKYLLGRILVVDNIDNALSIARKYKYSIRIVTLEGEQLNPGGSMTGGAFKNNSNLLGRRREMEDLEKQVLKIEEEISAITEKLSVKRNELALIREKLELNNYELQNKKLDQNTIEVSIKQIKDKKEEINSEYASNQKESAEIDNQIEEINSTLLGVFEEIKAMDKQNAEIEMNISELMISLEEKKETYDELNDEFDKCNMECLAANQKCEFNKENISRIKSEINKLKADIEDCNLMLGDAKSAIDAKQESIKNLEAQIVAIRSGLGNYDSKLNELRDKKEEMNKKYKDSFAVREEISLRINELSKDEYRLTAQIEKLEESIENQTQYMWDEYELTYNMALPLKDESLKSSTDIKKNISSLKSGIKSLGDVNVNAIEEYKAVSERYEFLKAQYEDLTKAEESLVKIIGELDNEMRKQFMEKFNEIKVEFDKVFKELFGGGKGEIELVEGEDILEAGITIISQPPGKKLQNMMQLSGGEKALTAISLLFAIQNLKPSPFCLLDEIEAALDDSNVGRYAQYLHKLTKNTQFIVITHRRGTMAAADRLYGITMQEKGVSTLVSVDLIEKDLEKEKE